MAGQFVVSGQAAGIASGYKFMGPATIVGSSVVGTILDVDLVLGANTVSIPTGALGVWIVPPAANTQTLKIRTSLNAADTGLPISASDPFGPFMWRGLAPTTLVLTAGGAVAGVELSFI